MKLKSITIENIKSFKQKTTVEFETSNVLLGPNGGGKSNLMDIITIVVRYYFIYGYQIHLGRDERGSFKNINQERSFNSINKELEKFLGEEEKPSSIHISFEVGEGDVENIRKIKSNKKELERILSGYRQKPYQNLELIDRGELDELQTGQTLTYQIENYSEPVGNEPAMHFLEYLKMLELVLILAKDYPEIDIMPNYIYFSPYRGANPGDLQANLSNENYYDILFRYFSSTSKVSTSLIKLATLYFSEKRRRYESEASTEGYEKRWLRDLEVKKLTYYLNRLGYSWRLDAIDTNTNTYEIIVSRDDRDFRISQASSGEKEILNFLLGIFAFSVSGGMIVIDEPELHLHPRWQAILRNLFIDLSVDTGNQFLVSTHSPVFITPKTIKSVRRVYRKKGEGTQVRSISDNELADRRQLLHIVNTQNNEKMFFADKVVLVEGIKDRIIFERLLSYLRRNQEYTEVIEVIEVAGKDYLERYRDFLNAFGVTNFIIADRDYIDQIGTDEVKSFLKTDWSKINKNVLQNKKSKDVVSLAENLENAIQSGDLEPLKNVWQHIKGRHIKLREQLSDEQKNKLDSFIKEKRSCQIYNLWC